MAAQLQGWQKGVIDVQAFRNQTISVRFRTEDVGRGRARIDNVRLYTDIPAWTPAKASDTRIVNDENSLDGAYLQLNNGGSAVVSTAFTVPGNAQALHFDYMSWVFADAVAPTALAVDVLVGTTSSSLGR